MIKERLKTLSQVRSEIKAAFALHFKNHSDENLDNLAEKAITNLISFQIKVYENIIKNYLY